MAEKRCPDCGGPVGPGKVYCAPACRAAFHNRMSKRGRVILPIALGWRAGRGSGDIAKAAFLEMCAYLDHCNAEDFKAGRPPMVEYLKAVGVVSFPGWRERA
jgi:hypothetical protein